MCCRKGPEVGFPWLSLPDRHSESEPTFQAFPTSRFSSPTESGMAPREKGADITESWGFEGGLGSAENLPGGKRPPRGSLEKELLELQFGAFAEKLKPARGSWGAEPQIHPSLPSGLSTVSQPVLTVPKT